MPGTHVALIRGINVGRAKRVAMAELRSVFADLGYQDVRTVLNSGNVVFSAGSKRQRFGERIQKEIAGRCGVDARVLVLTRSEYLTAVEENVLGSIACDPTRLLVVFCATASQFSKLTPLLRMEWSPEAIAIGTVAAYAWCAGGILDSALLKAIGRVLAESATTRNWATITRIRGVLVAGDELLARGRRPTRG